MTSSCARRAAMIACAALLGLATITIARAADPTFKIAGPAETVFRHAQQACEPDDIPDIPARAFRSADGSVRLVASHFINRAMVGRDLTELRHDCRVIFRGAADRDPAAFNDHAWLSSFYTTDGKTIVALVHNEFHGQLRPDLCPSAKYMECWSNAVTTALSRDSGANFARPGAALVASLPYRYGNDAKRPVGYFGPTNMLRRGNDVYVMVQAEAYRDQKRGMCLLRSATPDDPQSWRAWDGHDFTVRFIDPYHADDNAPATHVCTPVGADKLVGSLTSLVQLRSGLYVATMIGRQVALPGGRRASGVYYATSSDLVTWSPARLLWETPVRSDKSCSDAAFFGYPALLDPASKSLNFETFGDSGLLFMTRFNQSDCKVGLDRDLVRLKVTLSDG